LLTERFRPKTAAELVGNQEEIAKLRDNIKNGKHSFVVGPPGVGKTTAVHVLGRELGFGVVEYNMSDTRNKDFLSKVLRMSQAETFVSILFLFEEVDGLQNQEDAGGWSVLVQIVKNSRHPVVLTANDFYKIGSEYRDALKHFCEVLKFSSPGLGDVMKRIAQIEKVTGLKADITKISGDVRKSIVIAFYGGESYESLDDFDVVKEFFTQVKTGNLSKDHLVWLMDNGTEFYKGRNLYRFYRLLAVASRSGRMNVLECMERGYGDVKAPRYLRRMKVFRGKEE